MWKHGFWIFRGKHRDWLEEEEEEEEAQSHSELGLAIVKIQSNVMKKLHKQSYN